MAEASGDQRFHVDSRRGRALLSGWLPLRPIGSAPFEVEPCSYSGPRQHRERSWGLAFRATFKPSASVT